MIKKIKEILLALLNLCLGLLLGLLMLEILLQNNPRLLLRGVSAPMPIDLPLTTQQYAVHYSDANVFIWRPDLVRPLHAEENRLEAQVVYQTDELGFRNAPPLPDKMDIVILGRSNSQAAHLPAGWPEILAEQSGMQVLNLSQPGSSIHLKRSYLENFGMPRRPRWVIVEVVPQIDIVGTSEDKPVSLTVSMLPPLTQSFLKPLVQQDMSTDGAIYPLQVDLPAQTIDLTCCIHYMDFYTADQESLQKSQDWTNFSRALLDIRAIAQQNGACMVLFYAPTKPDIYFSLAANPEQLTPTLSEYGTLHPNEQSNLVANAEQRPDIQTVLDNLPAGQRLLQTFAETYHIPLIDPTEQLSQAILDGQNPFMVYDSHWNYLGNEIIAQAAWQTLTENTCP